MNAPSWTRKALRGHIAALALDVGGATGPDVTGSTPAGALATGAERQPGLTSYQLGLLALHAIGLLAVVRLAHFPPWSGPLLLAVFSLPMFMRRRPFAEALAPLALLYATAVLRLTLIYVFGRADLAARLSYGWALSLSAGWTGLIMLQAAGRLRWAALLAGLGATFLMVFQLLRLAPAGVTGSDPFAYVQMALDLVEHGTLLHRFPLVMFAASLGLPTLPVTHVGYVLPSPDGWAPTVWPPGYSVVLAGAYRIAGERAISIVNAGVGLVNLALVGLLAALLTPRAMRPAGWAAAMGATVLLATSHEQFVRLVVPLADGAAQLFTSLSVVLTLLALRDRGLLAPSGGSQLALGALAGLALAAAFSVRYTQGLVAPGLVLSVWLGIRSRRQRILFTSALLAVGALAAAPDAVYRTGLFGAPWRFGSGELSLFAMAAIPEAIVRLAADVFARAEFGWLWPLALLGLGAAWTRRRGQLLTISAAYLPPLLFHLWYPFLRGRDVLFIFVPLAALTALGVVTAATWLWRLGQPARAAAVAALLILGALRVGPALELRPGFFTFGYLLPHQRSALASLAIITEADAVIACSLNSGAVELYGRRATVRPGGVLQPGTGWNSEQWLAFVNALRADGRPVYLLMDSPELEQPLADLQAHYTVRLVAALDVPVYYRGGGSENLTVPLYQITALPSVR